MVDWIDVEPRIHIRPCDCHSHAVDGSSYSCRDCTGGYAAGGSGKVSIVRVLRARIGGNTGKLEQVVRTSNLEPFNLLHELLQLACSVPAGRVRRGKPLSNCPHCITSEQGGLTFDCSTAN